jgi:hypothetical protein
MCVQPHWIMPDTFIQTQYVPTKRAVLDLKRALFLRELIRRDVLSENYCLRNLPASLSVFPKVNALSYSAASAIKAMLKNWV